MSSAELWWRVTRLLGWSEEEEEEEEDPLEDWLNEGHWFLCRDGE